MRISQLLFVICTALPLPAQSPAFEVATVKVNHSGDNSSGFPALRNGTLTGRNVTMRMMLRAAYGLSESRISGPDWLDSDRFDLAGKAAPGVPDSELMPMFQTLLKDRFQLEVHREMREMPVFDMIVAKAGLKMSLSSPEHPFPTPPPNPGGYMNFGAGTLPEIAMRLAGSAGRPILDKTGLEGRYGFLLIYTPVSTQTADEAAASGPPDFFMAVEQQLGLKLEPNKEPLEVLVVDHSQRVPTEN
jgi:uncharacterized protein (TIGR03435 family)